MNECHCEYRRDIIRSDKMTITRCKACGRYWLIDDIGERQATPVQAVLCELVEALSRYVPKAVTL